MAKQQVKAVKAAIYTRISLDREGQELGVKRQREDCIELAKRKGLLIVAEYEDNDRGASTRSKKPRPDWDRMLKAAKNGDFDVIVAYTTSRLTRRPREHEDLIELAENHGISYRFVRSPEFDLNTANGRMVARILAAADAGEAEETGERITRQRKQSRKNGGYIGVAPYGYRNAKVRGHDGSEVAGLEVIDSEARVVRSIVHSLLAGISPHHIAKRLNNAGVPTKNNGKGWTAGTLWWFAHRPEVWAGIVTYRGQVIGDGAWQPIITREEYELLAALYQRANPHRRKPGRPSHRMLQRLLRCGKCGSTLAATGKKALYYCVSIDYPGLGKTCGSVHVLAEHVESEVRDRLLDRILQTDRDVLIGIAGTDADGRSLFAELADIDKQYDKLAEGFISGRYDEMFVEKAQSRLRQARESVNAEINRKAKRKELIALPHDPEGLREAWDAQNVTWRTRMVQLFVKDIQIEPIEDVGPLPAPTCKIEGCDRRTDARGLCSKHYQKFVYDAKKSGTWQPIPRKGRQGTGPKFNPSRVKITWIDIERKWNG